MTRRRIVLTMVASVTLIGALAVGTGLIVTRSPFFRIRAIEVVGLRYIDEPELIARLGLTTRSHILVKLAPIEAKVGAIPGVRAVRVSRRWPATLRVDIEEAVPVALVQAGTGLVMLDDGGRVLPFDPTKLSASLPLADRDAALAGLLARLTVADPLWYARVERASVERGDAILDTGDQRIRLRTDAGPDVLRQLISVRQFLAEDGIVWRELDARFAGRVFVRRGSA